MRTCAFTSGLGALQGVVQRPVSVHLFFSAASTRSRNVLFLRRQSRTHPERSGLFAIAGGTRQVHTFLRRAVTVIAVAGGRTPVSPFRGRIERREKTPGRKIILPGLAFSKRRAGLRRSPLEMLSLGGRKLFNLKCTLGISPVPIFVDNVNQSRSA